MDVSCPWYNTYSFLIRAVGSRLSVSIVEEVSRKTKDARHELRKYLRDVKKNSPEKKCKMEYDRLLVEDKVFIYRF